MFSKKDKLIAACSGGLDSTALVELLYRGGWTFRIAHCNFGLRGAESDGDADFVRHWAEARGLDCREKRFDTAAYALENRLSIQEAARILRYSWLEEIRQETESDYIVTGHQLDDAAETLLLNLIRGAGLKGLAGMRKKNGRVVRPLLFASRAELAEWVGAENIHWREDSSNAEDDYTRNFVRHHIMPLFKQLNPDFLHTAERMMDRVRGADENLTFLLQQHLGDGTELEKTQFERLPNKRQALAARFLPFGFSEEQIRQLDEGWQQTGLTLQSDKGAYSLLLDRHHLIFTAREAVNLPSELIIQADDLMVTLPDGRRLILLPSEPIPPFPDGREAVLIDADKLRFPLKLRTWRAGDSFQPFGLKGRSQKLQDYFTNQKLSRLDKEKVWLLENADGAVIWLIAHRLDERFAIQPTSIRAVKIQVVNPV